MVTTGFTFLSRVPGYQTQHLYIIIAIVDDNEAILVNVTTKKGDKDDTCILSVGDHDFIKRESVINYRDTTKTSISNIKKAIGMRTFTPQDPVSDDLLQRIQKGALISPFLLPKYLKYIPTT